MEWIKVEDRLPVNNERVLICKSGIVDSAYYDGYRWKWDMSHHVPDAEDITHWMELPKPPDSKSYPRFTYIG